VNPVTVSDSVTVTVSVTVSVSVSVSRSDAPRVPPPHFHAPTGGPWTMGESLFFLDPVVDIASVCDIVP